MVCLFGLGFVYWYLHPPALVSDPSIARTNPDYDRATHSGKAPEPITTNVFTHLQISTNGEQVEIEVAENQGKKEELFGFKLGRASELHQVSLESGLVFLKYIAVAWEIPTKKFNHTYNVPAKFYNAALDPIATESVRPKLNDWDKMLNYRGAFPQVRFLFGVTNMSKWKLLGMDLFDARTHRSLSSGYSSSSTADGFYVEPTLKLWHKAPVELIVHVAHGKPQSFDIDPESRDELQVGPARVKLGGIIPNRSSGISTSSDGRTNRVSLNMATGPDQAETALVLFVWPNACAFGSGSDR
jgi:hypothetical protein